MLQFMTVGISSTDLLLLIDVLRYKVISERCHCYTTPKLRTVQLKNSFVYAIVTKVGADFCGCFQSFVEHKQVRPPIMKGTNTFNYLFKTFVTWGCGQKSCKINYNATSFLSFHTLWGWLLCRNYIDSRSVSDHGFYHFSGKTQNFFCVLRFDYLTSSFGSLPIFLCGTKRN